MYNCVNMELISTIFGGMKLIYNGHIYIKDKDPVDVTYWRCEKRGIDVIPCYEELVDSLSDQLLDDLSNFLHYFENTWIGVKHNGRRRRPLFSIEIWIMRDRVERALPRTNNSVEGWHRAFDIRINTTHPSMSKLIRKIILEQSDTEIVLQKFRCGHELSKSKKKYVQLNKRIQKLVEEYVYIPHLEYLHGISYNLSF